MNEPKINNINCPICGKTLKEYPDGKECEEECSNCGLIWGVKPKIVWDYWVKYNKDKIKIKEN